MKKLVVAGAFLASMGCAFAQGYAGALIGLSHATMGDCSTSCDESGNGGKVYLGGHVNKFFGVEVAYIDFGNGSGNAFGVDYKASSSAYVATTVWRWAFAPRWTGAVKGGFAVVESSLKYSGQNKRNTRAAPYFGLGVDYGFASDWHVVGQFDLTNYQVDGEKDVVYLFGAGVQKDF